MPEAAMKKFRFYEMVPKGTGHKVIEQKMTCTAAGAVEIMNFLFMSERFAIDSESCKKNMSPAQQREAFGCTISEMEQKSAPVPAEVAEVATSPVETVAPVATEAESNPDNTDPA